MGSCSHGRPPCGQEEAMVVTGGEAALEAAEEEGAGVAEGAALRMETWRRSR